MSKAYFAQDGNYGSADGITVVDTEEWTDEDWQAIDECLDDERPWQAELIARKHGAKRWEIWYRDYETGVRPFEYAPLFQTEAEAREYLGGHDWEGQSAWTQEAMFCAECFETVGNSVMEYTNGGTVCHKCLTKGE